MKGDLMPADVSSVDPYALGPVGAGDPVIVNSVDRYGLQGRAVEPPAGLIGCEGYVIGPAARPCDEGVYFYAVAFAPGTFGDEPCAYVFADYELARP